MAHEQQTFDDLSSFVAACEKLGDLRVIEGASWDLEISALVEGVAEAVGDPPLLLFDRVEGYPAGRRIATLLFGSTPRLALALGLPTDATRPELVRLAARRFAEIEPLAPIERADGSVLTHQYFGDDIDVLMFPALRSHPGDGGRYIGTGDTVINRDPDSGYVNSGTYRMQVHERNLLGLWMSPGQQGRQICEKYWARGEACPIAATFGADPVVFWAANQQLPWGVSELAWAGGVRGRPVEVVPGPLTGLPIPAHAEIAIEGEVPPPSQEARDEGPFGEWPGYYSGGSLGTGEPQPVVRVQALYHRADPILHDQAPLWPGAQHTLRFDAGVIWHQLEAAGIQGIQSVHTYNRFLIVVSINQRMPGHALQVGLGVLSCSAGARNGRYVVVVDEDIEPSNIQEVLWAMETRVDPATDIRIVEGAWGSPLDPRMPPSKRASGDYTNSRAVFLAVRPFHWRDKFPSTSRADRELKRTVMAKYADALGIRSPKGSPEPR